MRLIPIIAIIVTGLGPALAAWTTAPAKIKSDRIKLVRTMYEKVPPIVLEMVEPVEIAKGTIYEDGGTIVLVLKDAKGKVVEFGLDRKIGSSTRDVLFISVNGKNAKAVLLRGPEEAALYGLLLRWKAPSSVAERIPWAVGAMLDHLDHRFAGEAPALKEKE